MNKQDKQKIKDTDNSVAVTRDKGGGEGVVKSNRDQIHGVYIVYGVYILFCYGT